MAGEILEHKSKKDSTVKWFVIGLIPILNLYLLWKSAENIAGHEVIIKKYESLNHMLPKDDTLKWFAIFFIPVILGTLMIPLLVLYYLLGMSVAGAWFFITIIPVFAVVTIGVGLYMLYKQAIVVSGHEKVYETHEKIEHMKKKESTGKWMVFGMIPPLSFYFLWKLAEVIAGHEVTYGSEEELEGSSGHEHGRAEEGERPYCPECGNEISMGSRFCTECGAEIGEEAEVHESETVEEEEHEHETVEEEEIRECPVCGAETPGDAKYCPTCGLELEEEEE